MKNISNWSNYNFEYIPFPDYKELTPRQITQTFNKFDNWLEENVGERWVAWDYRVGDRYGQGIYFTRSEDAVMFKIRFQL